MASRYARLAAYHDDEAALVLSQANNVKKRGHVENPADIYPDIPPLKHVSYVRTPLPLAFLILLYERTVIFVPPMKKADLEQRWGLPMSRLVDFAQTGIIQPIIGHAVDYTAAHFDALLETRPPSLWARGLALLEDLDMGWSLTERGCPLPVNEMAGLESLRRKYGKYFPKLTGDDLTRRIKRELLTNYADLCIFGEHLVADSFQYLQTAQQVADRLILANEVRTYPILFGMGGTANYDSQTLRQDAIAHKTLSPVHSEVDRYVIPSNLPLLLAGMGIDVISMDAHLVTEFHSSGNGQLLRKAIAHFEKQARKIANGDRRRSERDKLIVHARELERAVTLASRELASASFVRRARRAELLIRTFLKVGSPAVGGWLGHMMGASVLEGIGGAAVLQQVVVEPVRERIVDAALVARFRPGLANLWRIMRGRNWHTA